MKKVLLFSSLVAILLAAAAVFMLFKDSSSEVKGTTLELPVVTEEVVDANAPISGTDTMTSLLARGENLECTIKYSTSDAVPVLTEGTFFTSQNRLRGDFIVSNQGTTDALSSMILRDDTMYSWTEIEGEKYGMKISMAELNASKSNDENLEAREVVPLDAAVTYECKPWVVVDGSVFEPPSDILFKDFGDLVNTGMEFGTVYEEGVGGAVDQCALCDKVEGEGKKECKAAFSCE